MKTRWRPPACDSSKASYRTQGDAIRAITFIERENAQAVAPLPFQPRNTYHCDCGAWHLTKQRARVAA